MGKNRGLMPRKALLAIIVVCIVLGAIPALGAPVPVATGSSPGNQMVGEGFSTSVCLNNEGNETGYQPIYEMVIPQGVSFDSAQYLGDGVSTQVVGTCNDPSGCTFTDPDTGEDVAVPANATLILLRYPLGSFTPNQPPQCMSVSFNLGNSPQVTLGVPLNIAFTPVFTLGADALDNPDSDPPIRGSKLTLQVVPQVITISKSLIAPEGETATGPNYPRTARIVVNVANGETVNGVTVSDTLPGTMQFVTVTNNGSCNVIQSPSTSTPGGTLVLDCGDITGTSSSEEKVVEFSFYVPEKDANGDPILNPGPASITNNATANATYQGNTTSAEASGVLSAKALATQKSAALVNDTGPVGYSPGDTVEYTINLQVSDYFCLNDTAIYDTLGDGLSLDTGSNPTISVTEGGTTLSGSFSSSSFSHVENSTSGETYLTFDVSTAIQDIGASDGVLSGDQCADGDTDDGATTVTIRFNATIDDNYTATPEGTVPISMNDRVENQEEAESSVVGGGSVSDTSHATVVIQPTPTIQKYIYAVNGNTTVTTPVEIAPNDTVTYRIRVDIPMASFENATITDYLPKPFLNASEITGQCSSGSCDPPPAGQWALGPDDNLTNTVNPTLSIDSSENTITWHYGTYEGGQDASKVIDLLFTVTATDNPMADNLNLANLATTKFSNSAGVISSEADATLLSTDEPVLEIKKEIVSSTNPNSQAATPPSGYDSAWKDADGGDVLTFTTVVSNTGGHDAYDVKLTDRWAQSGVSGQGFSGCTLVSVKDDSGNDIQHSGDLFSGELTLGQSLPSGANATITYNCTVDNQHTPGDPIENSATITHYSSTSGGPNYATNTEENTSRARVGLAGIQITKSITGSSLADTSPDNNINKGEILTYTVTVTLAEGTYQNLSLTDTQVSVPQISCSAPFSCSNNVSVSGDNVTVTGTQGSTSGTITYTYSKQQVASGTNTATAQADNAHAVSDTASWSVDGPDLVLNKSVSPSTVEAGESVTFTLAWQNSDSNNPAYQCLVTDTIDGNVFDLDSVTLNLTSGASDYTCSYDNSTGEVSCSSVNATSPCQPGTLEINAKVRGDVITGSDYQNTATITGTSLPAGHQGDGNSTIEGTYSGQGDTTLAVKSATVTKTFLSSSESSTDPGDTSLNSNPPVAVGEVVEVSLRFVMPQGVTKDANLIDRLLNLSSLPWGEYVEGSAQLARSSSALTCAENPGNINNAQPGTFVPVTPTTQDSTNQRDIFLQLGDVTNSNSNQSTEESYTLKFKVVVLNNSACSAGTVLKDYGLVSYKNANNATQWISGAEHLLHIAEPVPRITKTATPSSLQGGDGVGFTLNICNTASGTSAATAFDLDFTDPLPSQYENPHITSIDTGTTGATVNAAFSGNTLHGTVDRLQPGQCVTVDYNATMSASAQFGSTYTNTATVRATSLPGTRGTNNAAPGGPGEENGERTGSGSGSNDLYHSDSAEVSVSVPSISKESANATSYYAIGEEPGFRILVGVPQGGTSDLVVNDKLPQGLSFVTGSLNVTLPTGTSTENEPVESNATFFHYDTVTHRLRFDFGQVTASASGSIVIEYRARVENISSNQDGTLLTNTANATIEQDNGQLDEVGSSTNTIRVGEPNLEMSKSLASSPLNLQAGDTVSWKVELTNQGHTTAYQVNWQDLLPNGLYHIANPHLSYSGGTVLLNGSSTPVSDANLHISSTTNDNDTITLDPVQIPPGATLSITYDSVLMNSVSQGEVLTNKVRANYTSLVNGGRDASSDPNNADDDDDSLLNNYGESASSSITVSSNIAIGKIGDVQRAAIGELVIYAIRVDVIEGSTLNVKVHDTLPQGLAYVGHSIEVGNEEMFFTNPDYNTRLGSGQVVEFDLGNVVNPDNGNHGDDYFKVLITARVENIASNQDGTVLENGNSATSPVFVEYGTSGSTLQVTQPTSLRVTEPQLKITKWATPQQQSLGDLVTFTVRVEHDSNSTANAYDLVVTDTLPQGLSFVDCSLPSGSYSVNGQTLRFTRSRLTTSNPVWQFTYRARIALDATVGVPLSNNAVLSWKSLPGGDGSQESGRTGTGGINDYSRDTTSSVVPTTAAFIDAKKTVSIYNDADSSVDLTPGDTIEYTITLHNSNGAATGVVFTDTVPDHTTYLAGSLTTTQGTAVESSAPDLSVNVGDMGSNSTVTITFKATVDPGTPPGTVISNQGSVDSDQTVPELTDRDGNDANGDQPTKITVGGGTPQQAELYAWKFAQWLNDNDSSNSITPGDTMRYWVVIENKGEVDLTGVSFTDTIPSGLTYAGNSYASDGTLSISGSSLTWTGCNIATVDYQYIWFDVTVDSWSGNPTTKTFSNQGTADSDQTNPVQSDGNGVPGDGAQPTVFEATNTGGGGGSPAISASKSCSLFLDANKDGLLGIGDEMLYTITIQGSGTAPATNVRLEDPIPAHTQVVPGYVYTSQGTVVSEDPVKVNIGTVEPAKTVKVYFVVKITSEANLGESITNTATVTADNGISQSASTHCTVQSVHLFDPPSATKVANSNGWPYIQWKQVWINDGNAFAIAAKIEDPIPPNTEYVAGSLHCEARGVSTTAACYYNAANNTVYWQGNIGPDPGATNENNANNEVVIVFRTKVDQGINSVQNQARAFWDENGDGVVDARDPNLLNNQPVLTDDPSTNDPSDPTNAQPPPASGAVSVPTMNQWGMLLFALVAGLMALQRLRRRARE